MPADQPNDTSFKSPFVRSRSLRLPPNKANNSETQLPSGQKVNSHIRHSNGNKTSSASSTASASNSASKHLSLFRRPLLKNKTTGEKDRPISKSPSHRALSVDDPRRNHLKSSIKALHDNDAKQGSDEPTPSDSPTSIRSDRSHSSHGQCCLLSNVNNVDLFNHLRRLTDEHEKLQVEYARLRVQLIEQNAAAIGSALGTRHGLSHSDSHLASIPETADSSPESERNSNGNQLAILERLVQGYQSEIMRLEEELRKAQKKYWEMVMGREQQDEHSLDEASHQVVELLDQLERKHTELTKATSRVHVSEAQLSEAQQQAHQSQESLQDCQALLEEATAQREGLHRKLRDTQSDLVEARESADFLAAERNTFAESLQETEQALQQTRAELERARSDIQRLTLALLRSSSLPTGIYLESQINYDENDGNHDNEDDDENAKEKLAEDDFKLKNADYRLFQTVANLQGLLESTIQFATDHLGLHEEVIEAILNEDPCQGDEASKSNGAHESNGDQESEDATPLADEESFEHESNALVLLSSLVVRLDRILNRSQDKFLYLLQQMAEERQQQEDEAMRVRKQLQAQSQELNSILQQLHDCRLRIDELTSSMATIQEEHREDTTCLENQVWEWKEKARSLEVQMQALSERLHEEVQNAIMSSSTDGTNSFSLDAATICDKLLYRQEVARLKEVVRSKEELVSTLNTKCNRTRKVLEDNCHRAEREVKQLENVLKSIAQAIEELPQEEKTRPSLQQLYQLANSGPSPNTWL